MQRFVHSFDLLASKFLSIELRWLVHGAVIIFGYELT